MSQTVREIAMEINKSNAICSMELFRTCNTDYISHSELKALAAHVLASTEPLGEITTAEVFALSRRIGELSRENDNLLAEMQARSAALERSEQERAICYWNEGTLIAEKADLRAQLQAAQQEEQRLNDLFDKAHADATIAHRFIESLVGEQAQGRDFAVKVPMAEELIDRQRKWQQLADERGRQLAEQDAALEKIFKLLMSITNTADSTTVGMVRKLISMHDERGREVERLRADFDKLGDWISPDIEAKRECTMSAGALNQMRKIYRSMREVLCAPAATPPAHAYTSTACQHGLHDRCRKACKFCGTPCLCACGHETVKPPAQEQPDTAIEWRISYEYCQGGLLGTQHEEWDAFSATVANKEICAEFVAEITDKMHRNIRIESRGPWVDAARTAPEAQEKP